MRPYVMFPGSKYTILKHSYFVVTENIVDLFVIPGTHRYNISLSSRRIRSFLKLRFELNSFFSI